MALIQSLVALASTVGVGASPTGATEVSSFWSARSSPRTVETLVFRSGPNSRSLAEVFNCCTKLVTKPQPAASASEGLDVEMLFIELPRDFPEGYDDEARRKVAEVGQRELRLAEDDLRVWLLSVGGWLIALQKGLEIKTLKGRRVRNSQKEGVLDFPTCMGDVKAAADRLAPLPFLVVGVANR